MMLYHGSHKKLSRLTPLVSTHGEAYVYASPFYAFSLCFSGNKWDDSIINQCRYNGTIILTEIKQNAFKETFDTDGYMHYINTDKLKNGSFEPLLKYTENASQAEYVCKTEVIPTSIEYIENVYKKLKGTEGIILYPYPSLPSFIPSRESYLRRLNQRRGKYNEVS